MGRITITSGSLRRRTIQTPPGQVTRPMLTRVRKSLADILRPRLNGARVLDVFGGSGAIAIELISNGAAGALCIERDATAVVRIRENARSLGITGALQCRQGDGVAALAACAREGMEFDVIVIAPPYGRGLQQRAVAALQGLPLPLLQPGGVVVVQREKREQQESGGDCLRLRETRTYGRTVLDFYEPI